MGKGSSGNISSAAFCYGEKEWRGVGWKERKEGAKCDE